MDVSVTGICNAVTFTILSAWAIACNRRKSKLGSALEGMSAPKFNMAMYNRIVFAKGRIKP
jgi:hypothetical protein